MELYLKSGKKLTTDYTRIVIGSRGPYVEFTEDQLCLSLKFKFDNITNRDIYYYWLTPVHSDEKIYYQLRSVKYANYKVGMYYISPKDLKNFHYEGEQYLLFTDVL